MQISSNGEFLIFNLLDLLAEIGEEKLNAILSDFSCPINKEIEYYIHTKAIEFAKDYVAMTYLVFIEEDEKLKLIAYFTVANKQFAVDTHRLKKNLKKSILHYAGYNSGYEEKIYIAAFLIAQLGKNYTHNNNRYISGDELIGMALKHIEDTQKAVGGKLCFIECENKIKLMDFYKKHGFVEFNRRKLSEEELKKSTTDEYVQMLRYRKIPKKKKN